MTENALDFILETLRTTDFNFQDNLKVLTMRSCNIDDHRFETLWFDVVPRFPNLSCLNLDLNRIESVQVIVDRIEKSDKQKTHFVVSNNSLRILHLENNPVVQDDDDSMFVLGRNPKEVAALVSFLATYNTIYRLSVDSFDSFCRRLDNNNYDERLLAYCKDVKYALTMNHAGRRIVESCRRGDKNNKPLPLSMWPYLLERAFETSDRIGGYETTNDPTGLHYLLCNGPALSSRTGFGGVTTSLFSSSSSNDDDDDDANGKNPNQRKLTDDVKGALARQDDRG